MQTDSSTIAALATAPFPSGLAVVRVSGPKSAKALKALFRGRKDPTQDPRRLIHGDLIDYKTNEVIGDALAVFMPAPHSYTGEDVVEFQFFGSPMLVQKILRSLLAFGVGPAEPGEFTKRAFLNGKIDLIQAEAIGELAAATSEQALKIAGEHLKGKLSQAVNELGEPIRNCLAEIEAAIDFPDENIEPQLMETTKKILTDSGAGIKELLRSYGYGHVLREGFRVLLCGAPNVGKSSILNLLLNKERAIVTEVSGTTRDLIEEQADLGGYRFVFCDSAGIRDTSDQVEKIGIALAKERVSWADLVLLVVDASDLDHDWRNVLSVLRDKAKKIWMVVNKIDLNPAAIGSIFCESATCAQNFYISAKTKSGLTELTQALIDEIRSSLPDRAESSNVVTSERQRSCLERALQALDLVAEAIQQNMPLEIVSAELRFCLLALEEIIGKTYSEDILGRIFSKFCIGK